MKKCKWTNLSLVKRRMVILYFFVGIGGYCDKCLELTRNQLENVYDPNYRLCMHTNIHELTCISYYGYIPARSTAGTETSQAKVNPPNFIVRCSLQTYCVSIHKYDKIIT